MREVRTILRCAAAALLATGSAAWAAPDTATDSSRFNRLPWFISADSVRSTEVDGASDDLLTAGLGQSGLAGAAPTFTDTLAPTAAELRRAAIYNNYRALADVTPAGGFGRFYGPAVGTDGSTDGRIAGVEVLAFSDDGSGRRNVTLMVQVPRHFDPKRPCIVTATSSGSRSVYGAISTGEWGLKRGCAVAYTDKGTHTAPHDLMADTVPLIDGTRTAAAAAGDAAAFRAPLAAAELAAFNAATPDRFAFKHAHSQRNPERHWGRFTLQAIEFAFWVLNDRYSPRTASGATLRKIQPHNTLVIASSISNGGGAAIAAAEQDRRGLIDAVVVSEPQVQLSGRLPVMIRRGANMIEGIGKPLFDYTTFANVFGPCAALSAQAAGTPFQATYVALFGALATQRCASLNAKGLLDAVTPAAQADEALMKMIDYGWERGAIAQFATFAGFETPSAVSMTYANALARAGVEDHLCGYSFAATTGTGQVGPLPAAALAAMFATGNGIPPGAGMQLVNNLSPGLPLRDVVSFSPSTAVQDMNLDGALCLRGLLKGHDAKARALQRGQRETLRNGNLHGKPTLIVQGRDDGLLPVNHTSRAYAALNKWVEGRRSRLSYIEVTNAQHFDGFIGLPTVLPGFDTLYVPLHLYLFRSLDLMWAHLTEREDLPPSQVVRTVPRGGTPGAAPALADVNVPPIAGDPAAADAITFRARTLYVPD